MPTYPAYKSFAGMDNVHDVHELPTGLLRNVVNMDVTDAGKLKQRGGFARIYTGAIAKGTLWAHEGTAFFVEGGDLKQLLPGNTAITLRSGIGNTPMAYLPLNGEIYYTNGVFTGRLTRVGDTWTSQPWGIVPPDRQPTLAAMADGELAEGVYQVAVTFEDMTGEESGTGIAGEVSVAAGGGIALSAIPQPEDSSQRINLYVTTAGGEVLRQFASLPFGTTVYEIRAVDNLTSRALATQHCEPPPAGEMLAYYNGRIYIAQGEVIWTTRALAYGLCKPAEDFYLPGGEVSILAPVTDGLYIVADRTYFITGTDSEDTPWTSLRVIDALPYGAVKGTFTAIPKSTEVAWFSHRGLVVAGPGGQAKNMSEDKVAVSRFSRGTMLYKEYRGLRQYVSVLQDGVESPYLAADYRTDEITRRGSAV